MGKKRAATGSHNDGEKQKKQKREENYSNPIAKVQQAEDAVSFHILVTNKWILNP